MKNLLYLLLIPMLFMGCGDDDEEITYLDNSLIEGDWYYIDASDSIVYTFKNNKGSRKTVDRYLLTESSKYNLGTYKLGTEYIYYIDRDSKSPYRLDEDSLFIKTTEVYFKYIRVKG